jgi:hypothetical protein
VAEEEMGDQLVEDPERPGEFCWDWRRMREVNKNVIKKAEARTKVIDDPYVRIVRIIRRE